jgi:hypothetical protein
MKPLAAGDPSRLDLAAAEELERNEVGRLGLIRARAEKWAGGLTALTGLLGTVLVGKAPENMRTIATPWRVVVGGLLAAALAALVFGTYRAYHAAYGNPGRLDQLSPQPITGLGERLATARRHAAGAAGTHLRQAVIAAGAAVGLLALGTGITWFAPTSSSGHPNRVCLLVDGKPVAEVATPVTVHSAAPGTTLGPCR